MLLGSDFKLKFLRSAMASELVNVATSEKLKEMDWTKNIEICELVSRDHVQAKDVVKSIKKRLGNRNPNTQLFSVILLEMLMNNCGEHIHKQVIDNGILPILVKIVKKKVNPISDSFGNADDNKKTDLPVRERIFLLLDATQTALGGASGKFPQYYAAYYDLVSAQVQFPRRPNIPPTNPPAPEAPADSLPAEESLSTKCNGVPQHPASQIIPDSSIIHKATSVLEVLQEVLDALDPRHPEGATDEFTLDLVEQCSFQKQRVMHLVMTSRDEKVVSQAIELNEKLHKVLTKHDTLLSVNSTLGATYINHEAVEEEEDEDRLLRRIRKGKACAEDNSTGFSRYDIEEKPRCPVPRPLCIEPSNVSNGSPPIPVGDRAQIASNGLSVAAQPVIIPPPPAKHMEREKFFKEKKLDGSTLARHMRGLSLDSRNGSSSHSGSTDFSDRDPFAS